MLYVLEKQIEVDVLINILKCNLYDGEPYIAEKDGKYHVLQGSMTADDVQKWHNTEEQAVYHWNKRVNATR